MNIKIFDKHSATRVYHEANNYYKPFNINLSIRIVIEGTGEQESGAMLHLLTEQDINPCTMSCLTA